MTDKRYADIMPTDPHVMRRSRPCPQCGDETCPECDGDGMVPYTDGTRGEHRCESCGGTGWPNGINPTTMEASP